MVELTKGVLIIDDSTLDKPYASQMALVSRHWSGKHHAVVQGINLISLVWTARECRLPCDYRLYNKAEDGLSKNDHFQHMIEQAKERGFEPELVVFDSWYSGLPNLKLLRSLEWHWRPSSSAIGKSVLTAAVTVQLAIFSFRCTDARFTSKGMAGSRSFGLSAQTATRNTGRPAIWI